MKLIPIFSHTPKPTTRDVEKHKSSLSSKKIHTRLYMMLGDELKNNPIVIVEVINETEQLLQHTNIVGEFSLNALFGSKKDKLKNNPIVIVEVIN